MSFSLTGQAPSPASVTVRGKESGEVLPLAVHFQLTAHYLTFQKASEYLNKTLQIFVITRWCLFVHLTKLNAKSIINSFKRHQHVRFWWSLVLVTQSCPSVTPWTIAHQGPLSMAFSRQEYWRIAISFFRRSSWPRDRTRLPALQIEEAGVVLYNTSF